MASERSEDATKGPRVSKSRRSHWTRYLTNLEYSNGNYANNNARVRMELEDLLRDGLLEWLRDDEPGFSGDVDLEQLLAAASDVYEQSTDPTPSDTALPACASACPVPPTRHSLRAPP